ncbi:hypothetical protein [Corynebacterium sp. HMSC071B10]|uniref:hypothetical protein n=1 Tax=Corynebacterium sp. HMSC071B10 TaxID=1739494 RepID=UPI0008A331D7|nr:hypothetical protein [Corynebacterium sp. HMSC071B10]OFP37905.1 hypothetical protein HMPREF2990_02195 [Corynebacterium sp. HMSC071B10]
MQPSLKKRAIAALISSVLATSATAVITPNAFAEDKMSADKVAEAAFQPVAPGTLRQFKALQPKFAQQAKGFDGAVAPLRTDLGPAWSIDDAANNLDDVRVRKLTGQSGRVGEGESLDTQVRVAAINLVKALQKDLQEYESAPSTTLKQQLEQKLLFTRALLGNDVATLNTARTDVLNNHANAFYELTGFKVAQRTQPGSANETLNYVLVPDTQKIEELTAGEDEYITVLLGGEGERLLSLYQPGLDLPDNAEATESTSTEYFLFAGFTADEKSKTIDLDLRIKGHWTFDVTEGAKYVQVTRGERDHELVLAPRPGFEGDATATVVITDEQANEHIYHLQLNNTINSEAPAKEPEQIIDAPPRAPEETVYRQLPTSTVAYIARNGGTAKVTTGQNLLSVSATEINGTPVWKVIPSTKGDEGTAHVVVTDADGTERPHDFDVVNRKYATKSIVHESLPYMGSTKLPRPAGGKYDVIQGEELVNITAAENGWIVTPNEDDAELKKNGGTAVINIKDREGRLVQNVTVYIAAKRPDSTPVHEVVDLSMVKLRSHNYEDNHFTVEPLDGASLDDFFENPEAYEGKDLQDDLQLRFKPGAEGKFKVTEFVRKVNQEVVMDEIGNVLEQKDNGYENTPVAEHIYSVTPFEPIESVYTITPYNELGLTGTSLYVTEGEDLLQSVPTLGESKIEVTPNRSAGGKVVIENRTEDGHVFERSIVNITPAERDTVVEKEMTWAATARINQEEGDTYKFVSATDSEGNDIDGIDLVRVREDSGAFVINGRAGKIGTVTIALSDRFGVFATYKLTITEPEDARVYNFDISTNGEFRASVVDKSNKFVVIDGEEHLETVRTDGNQWSAKPKADAAGKTVVIEEQDEDGNVISTYNLGIVQGKTTSLTFPGTTPTDNEFNARNKDIASTKRDADTGAITVTFDKAGGDIGIAEGTDLVDITREGNTMVLTPKQGVRGTLSFVPVIDNVQNTTGYSFDINTKSSNNGNTPKDGSADPKTVASSVGIATPLVLLLALIAVSQLPIPGLEGVRAQINAAIDNATKAFK